MHEVGQSRPNNGKAQTLQIQRVKQTKEIISTYKWATSTQYIRVLEVRLSNRSMLIGKRRLVLFYS